MRQVIVVHPAFERAWPFVAAHLYRLWREGGQAELIRLEVKETRTLEQLVRAPETVHRLVSFMAPTSPEALERFISLSEASFYTSPYSSALPEACLAVLAKHEVRTYHHTNLGFWAQSVAEFALALTLCALRRIPHLHHEMTRSLEPWDYLSGAGRSVRAEQFSDDPRFSHGTLAGKRVRIVGAGNIASRYASFASFMGADVSAWDPFASDPCFHRAGARREGRLEYLLADADIFAPMLPLTAETRGLVTAAHLRALPRGCLVVLCTRAKICDVPALRARVLADELSLAADVFDLEPVPLTDPLLGRHNVTHTPHVAGRTEDANHRFAEALAELFTP